MQRCIARSRSCRPTRLLTSSASGSNALSRIRFTGSLMLDFAQLATQCAPAIHANTLAHVVRAESDFNPFAIGVVGAHLERQPRNKSEAITTAAWLGSHHFNYSVGLAQINQAHFAEYGLTVDSAFDPCRNLQAAAGILQECYVRAYQ